MKLAVFYLWRCFPSSEFCCVHFSRAKMWTVNRYMAVAQDRLSKINVFKFKHDLWDPSPHWTPLSGRWHWQACIGCTWYDIDGGSRQESKAGPRWVVTAIGCSSVLRMRWIAILLKYRALDIFLCSGIQCVWWRIYICSSYRHGGCKHA